MKGIYEVCKKEIQSSIKRIAEKHGVGPMTVIISTDGEIFSELMADLEALGEKVHDEFDVPKATSFESYENFKSEVIDFICPDWNSTCEGDGSIFKRLNRKLVDAGYQTVKPEAIDLIIDELSEMRFKK